MIKIAKPYDPYRYLLTAFHLLDYVEADGRHKLHDQIGGCTQGDWTNLWITDEFSSTSLGNAHEASDSGFNAACCYPT